MVADIRSASRGGGGVTDVKALIAQTKRAVQEGAARADAYEVPAERRQLPTRPERPKLRDLLEAVGLEPNE